MGIVIVLPRHGGEFLSCQLPAGSRPLAAVSRSEAPPQSLRGRVACGLEGLHLTRRNWLARRKLLVLAHGIDDGAGLAQLVVQVRPGGEAGHSDLADHLAL